MSRTRQYGPHPVSDMKRSAQSQKQSKRKKRARVVGGVNPGAMVGNSPKFVPEKKWLDNWIYGQAITSGGASAGHVMLCNLPAVGPNSYQRIGRRIQITNVHIKVVVHPVTPVPTSVPEDLLFMLIWDQDATALPTLANLLTSTDTVGATSSTVYDGFNLNESKRFKILKKKLVPLRICGTMTGALPCNGAAFQAQNNDLAWDWHVKSNLITQFNAGAAGNITDISNGALVFTWWTSLGVGLPVSTFDVNSRIRYYD